MLVLMQDTQLYMLIRDVIHEIECITNLNPGANPADQVEDTCPSERNSRTYKEGPRTPGQASVIINVDPVNDSHYLTWQLAELDGYQDELIYWATGWLDNELVPIVSAGEMVPPTDRIWYTFCAYISDFSFDSQGSTMVSTAATMQCDGQDFWVCEIQPGSQDQIPRTNLGFGSTAFHRVLTAHINPETTHKNDLREHYRNVIRSGIAVLVGRGLSFERHSPRNIQPRQ